MAGEQLWVTEGRVRDKRLSVDVELLIGRAATEEDGKLGDDPELSRRHARLSRRPDGRLTIEDLGSSNGTYVNDERIDVQRTLGVGDVLRVGTTVLRVIDGPGAELLGSPGAGAQTLRPAPRGRVQEPASPPGRAGAELLITAGGSAGRRLAIGQELLIGRGVSGEGGLSDDGELSRRHARVARDASGRITIEDLGSANGTFVNGERLRGPHVLEVGDSVKAGSTTMQLVELGREAAPAEPAREAPVAAPAARRPAEAGPATPLHVPAKRAHVAPSAAELEGLSSELPLGSVIAGCRIEKLISHGDMAVVYRAEELALQRPVALKLIRPERSGEERFRERFRRESKVAAAIDHPNVIPIFDAGEEEDLLYITMRLVEGTDMRAQIAARGRIEPLPAARMIRQVGAALDAVHARGMLHRDVKPSNVLLARDDHVYLSDFGLAKRAEAVGGLTRQGSIVARAEYVAPEQILNEEVDARADIYALGCLLFETLTGEPPFARWTEGPEALAHLNAPVPSPVELRPELPEEFDEVVRRAMAKDPAERYPSAGDLGQAALVAAGGQPQAGEWSVVAIGEAGAFEEQPAAPEAGGVPRVAAGVGDGRGDALRWAVALAGLVIVAVGMVAALAGMSSL